MPKRIEANIDMSILQDIATGMQNKDIAVKYNVSRSYVSKVLTGRKLIDMQIPDLKSILQEDFEVYEDDITSIIETIHNKKILVNHTDVVTFIEAQITKSLVRAKVYSEILKKVKGE